MGLLRDQKLGYRRRCRLINFGHAQTYSISDASCCEPLGDHRGDASLRALDWTSGLVDFSCPSTRLDIGRGSLLFLPTVLGAREVGAIDKRCSRLHDFLGRYNQPPGNSKRATAGGAAFLRRGVGHAYRRLAHLELCSMG